ncbi:MAG: FG-GAP-like repeat-containing protein [Polyangiales bacterium]
MTAFVSLAAGQPPTDPPPDALGAMRAWLRATTATHERDVATVDLQTRWPSHSPDPAGLDAALREALPAPTEGGRTHLQLSARLEDGRVVLELTASATERSWFARFLGLRDAEERHRFEHPLDAPLRRHVAALPALTESTVVQRAFLLPSRDYLALAVTDLGDDGPNELVLLRADGVLEVFRLGSDGRGRTRIFPVAEAPLPAAPRPGLGSPRPFGMLTPDEGSVLVAFRDRDAIFRAHLEGRSLVVEVVDDALCPPGAMPMADACAMPVDARDYFASQLLSRTGLPAPARAPTSFYSRTRRRLHRADGSWGDVEAVVTPRGRLAVRTDARVVGVMGHGSALAMDDVDGDGQVELLASSDGTGPEVLHVFRVRADGGLRALWRSEPLEGSVFVAHAGDLDLDGSPELLAIEEPRDPGGRASLWVVR